MIWLVFSPLTRPPTLRVPVEPVADEVEERRFEAVLAPLTEDSELMRGSSARGINARTPLAASQECEAASGYGIGLSTLLT
jgi:hypothetical protein